MKSPRLIRMHADDNVAIVANDGGLDAGVTVDETLTLLDRVPQGHKVALRHIDAGMPVIRYGVNIGLAREPVAAGRWVHERLLDLPAPSTLRVLDGIAAGNASVAPDHSAATPIGAHSAGNEALWFDGYVNADGSVGTRNLLAISTTVQCVAGVLDVAVKRIEKELLPKYPNVDGVVGLEHSYGCGVAIDAPGAEIPIRTLRNISLNPNFGGEVLLVSLGCEKLQPERLLPPGSIPLRSDSPTGGFAQVRLQDESHIGFASMVDDIVIRAEEHLQRLNRRRRQRVPVSKLVVGVQCGGSDAFSGVTANPAVGAMTDLLVRAGGTVMFSENTEVRDAADQLTRRAANPAVANGIVRELAWYDQYLARGHADRSANTTPGNKAGGLSNIVEKAMGSIVKSGSERINSVLAPGEKLAPNQRGLIFAATPASDFICGTLQLAAGMNMHVFTTGRGTPYGLAACPVVKVSTRTELANRWHDLIDFNAGRIADGELSVEAAGRELLAVLLAVASGQRTWAEKWGLKNDLVLFNPAPIT